MGNFPPGGAGFEFDAARRGGEVSSIVEAGNLGATRTLDFGSIEREIWLVGTLSANCALTVTGLTAGVRGTLLFAQDGTGGRTLSINGTGLSIPAAAGQAMRIDVEYDGVDLYVELMGGVNGTNNYQTVAAGGVAQTQRGKLNLIGGSNITITPADNSGANSTDVTIAASGGGAATASGLFPLSFVLFNRAVTGTSGIGANKAEFAAFEVVAAITLDRLLTKVSTQAGNVDVGIYDATGTNGGPGAKVVSSGSTACPAAGLQKIAFASTVLQPGRYWAALAVDGAAAFTYVTGLDSLELFLDARYTQSTAFPLPATAAATVDTSGNVFFLLPTKS